MKSKPRYREGPLYIYSGIGEDDVCGHTWLVHCIDNVKGVVFICNCIYFCIFISNNKVILV